jgi:hypothetical protein
VLTRKTKKNEVKITSEIFCGKMLKPTALKQKTIKSIEMKSNNHNVESSFPVSGQGGGRAQVFGLALLFSEIIRFPLMPVGRSTLLRPSPQLRLAAASCATIVPPVPT